VSASTKKRASKQSANPKPNASARDVAWLERQLKRITAKALDDLKNPRAIPSRVILEALVEARQI
jgi:hypothetical protein